MAESQDVAESAADAAASATTVLVVTDKGDDPSVVAARSWAMGFAQRTGARLVVYDRSAETWGDTPHPSGLLGPSDPKVVERAHLAALAHDASAAGIDMGMWLSTMPSLGGIASAVRSTSTSLVVIPTAAAKRLAERLSPGKDPATELERESSRLISEPLDVTVIDSAGEATSRTIQPRQQDRRGNPVEQR